MRSGSSSESGYVGLYRFDICRRRLSSSRQKRERRHTVSDPLVNGLVVLLRIVDIFLDLGTNRNRLAGTVPGSPVKDQNEVSADERNSANGRTNM
jgi:hypothetical protein